VKLFFEEAVKEIANRIDLVSLVSRYLRLEKKGVNYQALCPFHEDHKPSLIVSPQKSIYKCFSCGAAGNLFKFVQEFEKISFKEAVEKLAQELGIEIIRAENYQIQGANKPTKEETEKQLLLEINQQAMLYFQKELKNPVYRFALSYLKEKRQLTERTIQDFSLGYSPGRNNNLFETVQKFIQQKIKKEKLCPSFLKEDFLLSTGLFSVYKDKNKIIRTKFFDRIIFPIKDLENRVIAFGARILKDKTNAPKYLNSPETKIFQKKNQLFALGLNQKRIKEKKEVILLEGYFDVVQAYQSQVDNAVACLGTAFTKEQALLLYKSNYDRNIVLGFDRDQAGLKAIRSAIEIFLDQEIFRIKPNLWVLDLERYKDLDELIVSKSSSPINLKKEDALKFLIREESKNFPEKNQDSLKKVKELLELINRLPEALEKEIYLEKCAEYFKFSQQVLFKSLSEIEESTNDFQQSQKRKFFSQRQSQENQQNKRKLSNLKELSVLRQKNIQLKTEKEILAFLLFIREPNWKICQEVKKLKMSLPELEIIKSQLLKLTNQSLEEKKARLASQAENKNLTKEIFSLISKLQNRKSSDLEASFLLERKLEEIVAYKKYRLIKSFGPGIN